MPGNYYEGVLYKEITPPILLLGVTPDSPTGRVRLPLSFLFMMLYSVMVSYLGDGSVVSPLWRGSLYFLVGTAARKKLTLDCSNFS